MNKETEGCKFQECENPNPPAICRKCGECEGSRVYIKLLPCPFCRIDSGDWSEHEEYCWLRVNEEMGADKTSHSRNELGKAWNRRPDNELVEALNAVLDAGDEGCCEECMDKDAIANAALIKYKKGIK